MSNNKHGFKFQRLFEGWCTTWALQEIAHIYQTGAIFNFFRGKWNPVGKGITDFAGYVIKKTPLNSIITSVRYPIPVFIELKSISKVGKSFQLKEHQRKVVYQSALDGCLAGVLIQWEYSEQQYVYYWIGGRQLSEPHKTTPKNKDGKKAYSLKFIKIKGLQVDPFELPGFAR